MLTLYRVGPASAAPNLGCGVRAMTPALRAASLSDDREELIAVLERNLPDPRIRALFRWRHEDNPAGPGWCWVIYNRQSGKIGAMTSLFPRPMYVDGKLAMCGQVGEFAVDHAYRSLGPAVMLQRATFQPVDSGELTLCFDCPPHDQGMSTFVRLGMRSSITLTRHALLLRSDEVVEKRLGKRAWTRPLIAGANLLLGARRGNRRTRGLEIRSLHGRFGDEFTHLDKIVPSSGIIRHSRSAELLNWNFCDRPEPNEVLVARRGGELLAFLALVFYQERDQNKRAYICDLFGRNLDGAGPALLSVAIEECRQRNVVCLEGYCSETSALKSLFEAAGFRARERAARIVAYAKPGEASDSVLSARLSWSVDAPN